MKNTYHPWQAHRLVMTLVLSGIALFAHAQERSFGFEVNGGGMVLAPSTLNQQLADAGFRPIRAVMPTVGLGVPQRINEHFSAKLEVSYARAQNKQNESATLINGFGFNYHVAYHIGNTPTMRFGPTAGLGYQGVVIDAVQGDKQVGFPTYLTVPARHVSMTNATVGANVGFQGMWFEESEPLDKSPNKRHYFGVGVNYYFPFNPRNWSQSGLALPDGPSFNPGGLQVRIAYGFL